jgi:release factor glutamine methyltransferase
MRGTDLIVKAARLLVAAGVSDPARDARKLLAHVLDIPASRLTLVLPEPVGPDLAQAYEALVARRAQREPVSHLIGQRDFYGRSFQVTPDVLDPRPETEILIEAALAMPFASVLDLGTGSGCIHLTLLSERSGAVGVATDLSEKALDIARQNATALGVKARAEFQHGSWYGALSDPMQFDLIVSNPPYIALGEMAYLSPEVQGFEPRMALTDEADGLTAYRALIAGHGPYLAPGGRMMVEIGPTQGPAVQSLMQQAGLCDVRILPDLDGRDRVVLGHSGEN